MNTKSTPTQIVDFLDAAQALREGKKYTAVLRHTLPDEPMGHALPGVPKDLGPLHKVSWPGSVTRTVAEWSALKEEFVKKYNASRHPSSTMSAEEVWDIWMQYGD